MFQNKVKFQIRRKTHVFKTEITHYALLTFNVLHDMIKSLKFLKLNTVVKLRAVAYATVLTTVFFRTVYIETHRVI